MGSIIGPRSATLLASLPALFLSHPTAWGRSLDSASALGRLTRPILLEEP